MVEKIPKEKELELIRLAKKGNKSATNKLISQFELLAYSSLPSRKLRLDEDAKARAMFPLREAIFDFDESKNNRLSTLIATYVRNDALDEIKKSKRKKRLGTVFSLDAPPACGYSDDARTLYDVINEESSLEASLTPTSSPEKILGDYQEKEQLKDVISKTYLNKKEVQVLDLYLQDKTGPEVGKMLDMKANTVYTHLNNIKNKFRQKYINLGLLAKQRNII